MITHHPCRSCGCIPSVIFRKWRHDPRTNRRIYAARCFAIPIYGCPCVLH